MATSSRSSTHSEEASTSSQPSHLKSCSQSHSPDPLTSLEPNTQYPSEQLVQFVRTNSPLQRHTTLSDLQRTAFERFWTSPLSTLQNHHTQRTDTIVVLKHFFGIFDDLFFNHSLKSSVVLSYTRDRSFDSTLGTTNRTLYGEQIAIDIISPRRSLLRSAYHPLKADVDALLREMCHAFLILWLCQECGGVDSMDTRQYEAAWQQLALVIEGNTWNDARFRGLNAELDITQLIGGSTPDHLQSPQPAVLRESKVDDWTIVEREVVDNEVDEESQRLVSMPWNVMVPAGRNKTRKLQKPLPMRAEEEGQLVEGPKKRHACRSCWDQCLRFMTWCGVLPKDKDCVDSLA